MYALHSLALANTLSQIPFSANFKSRTTRCIYRTGPKLFFCWKAAAASHQWSLVRLPAECFRFSEDPEAAAALRTSAEYVRRVLDAVGLSEGCENRGYSHLAPVEISRPSR